MFKPDKNLSKQPSLIDLEKSVTWWGLFTENPLLKQSLKKFPNISSSSDAWFQFSERWKHFAYITSINWIEHLIFDWQLIKVDIDWEQLSIKDIIVYDNWNFCCSVCKKPESNWIFRDELRRINHNWKNIDQQYEWKFFGKWVDKLTLSEDGKNIGYIWMEKQPIPPFSIFSVFVNWVRISNPSEDILNNSLTFLSNWKDVVYSYSEISEGEKFRRYFYAIWNKKVLWCTEAFPKSENTVSNFNQYQNWWGYFFKVVNWPLLNEHRVVDWFHLFPSDFDLPYYVKSFGINKFNLEYEDGIFKRSYEDEKGWWVVVTKFKLTITTDYVTLEDITNGTHKFLKNTNDNLWWISRDEWIGGKLTNWWKFIVINWKKFLLSFLLKKTWLEAKN